MLFAEDGEDTVTDSFAGSAGSNSGAKSLFISYKMLTYNISKINQRFDLVQILGTVVGAVTRAEVEKLKSQVKEIQEALMVTADKVKATTEKVLSSDLVFNSKL